ncbi:peptidylprolyl isomerase [Novosphingobium guangzhouense]|uniref:Peptidyl-prolyl cis-trans isomerase n=1 Tax=Novosphingobium guangzhouense TaxID=1850347 RepID=A0A2K2G573_9SPHN|nr:peptidylprolyl isomerase [Novosphingobium guangzhouense]PNU06187.1 peptidylprolyl isomerase [Novosphingobium guangzhouense]
MKFRLPLTALMLGAALVAAPAFAKDKDKKDEAAATPTPPPLPTAIDTDITHEPENVLLLDLSDGGRVAIRLMPQWAPHHVERIKTLAGQGFYNGQIFHRVIDGFMAQTGDPTGTGQGGSQLPDLQAEFNSMPHLRGTVSMARTNDPNSANSQFFIVFYPRFALDKKYTVFGRVISGMQYVDAIHRGEPPEDPTKIVQASLASENKPAPAAPVAPAAPALKAPSVSDLNNSQSN